MSILDTISAAQRTVGGTWRPRGDGDCQVFAFRGPSRQADAWDDVIAVLGQRDGRPWLWAYLGTTDPGRAALLAPMRPGVGTAIVAPGEYRDIWREGLHRGTRPALVQVAPVGLLRDDDRDGIVRDDGPVTREMAGINLHGPHAEGLRVVGWASAGCLVAYRQVDVDEILVTVRQKARKKHGDRVGLTLCDAGRCEHARRAWELLVAQGAHRARVVVS